MAKEDGMFLYIGTYPSEVAARADYDIVKDLHSVDVIGTYDAAVVTKDDEGKVHVNKDEMATRHAGWGGAAVGAVVGLLFPPAIIGSALVGGAIGGISGHLWRGISRSDVKELGELIDEGEAALLVVGRDHAPRSARQGRAEAGQARHQAGRREHHRRRRRRRRRGARGDLSTTSLRPTSTDDVGRTVGCPWWPGTRPQTPTVAVTDAVGDGLAAAPRGRARSGRRRPRRTRPSPGRTCRIRRGRRRWPRCPPIGRGRAPGSSRTGRRTAAAPRGVIASTSAEPFLSHS